MWLKDSILLVTLKTDLNNTIIEGIIEAFNASVEVLLVMQQLNYLFSVFKSCKEAKNVYNLIKVYMLYYCL